MATTAARLLLVDGHSVAYRAHFALPATIRGADGAPANALYGFVNILLRVAHDRSPTHAAVAFDLGLPFRNAMFAGYKASRAAGPEDLEPQVAKLRGLLAVLCVPRFEVEGFEADDLIATLVRQAGDRACDVDVLSGDLDILQLVRPGVRVVTPGKTFAEPVVYDEAAVEARYGVRPAVLRDWKALVGDTSDDVPGVAGIGKKTATELLRAFGSLDALYAELDRVASVRIRSALAAGRDAAFLSRTLVTLRDDAPVELDLDAARWGRFDPEAAQRAVEALGFASLAARVARHGDSAASRRAK
jgi:DNA polymerase-1